MEKNAKKSIDEELEILEREVASTSYRLDIWRKVKARKLETLMMRKLDLMIKLGEAPSDLQEEYEIVNNLQQRVWEKEVETQSRHIWWCCNPPANYPYQEFIKKVIKTMQKVWIKDYVYVIEQRGKTKEDAGNGFHIHALIKRPHGKRMCEIHREFVNTWQRVIDFEHERINNFWRLEQCADQDVLKRLNYMLGHKKDKKQGDITTDKALKQKYDRLFRKNNKLNNYYATSNFDLTDVQWYNGDSSLYPVFIE